VYAANDGSNNVSAYSIDASSGALTQLAGSPFGSGSGPFQISTCLRSGHTCVPAP
jgi:6-phosphogluconolactonase (cycloisomerase 2 family)